MADTEHDSPNSGGGQQHQQPAQAVAELSEFTAFLGRMVSVVFEDTTASITEAFKRALVDKTNTDCIRKFLSDPQIPILLVQRSSPKGLSFVFKYIIKRIFVTPTYQVTSRHNLIMIYS